MALTSITADSTIIWPNVQHSVWAKAAWANGWEYVPYLQCLRATERLSSAMPEASFVYVFGENKWFDDTDFANYNPPCLTGKEVCVVVHDYWSDWIAWCGVVEHESTASENRSDIPSGVQTFTAYGLEHLLDRETIHTTVTDGDIIGRAVRFNGREAPGLTLKGNRSTDTDDDGAYVFSSDGEIWGNADIAEHILKKHVDDTITWELTGETTTLNLIQEEHALFGLTPLQALRKLIPRQRGLGFRVMTSGAAGSTVYVVVFSILANGLNAAGISIPANPEQYIIEPDGLHGMHLNFDYSELSRFDTIKVLGGHVTSCFSLSYEDSTLEAGWTSTEEATYKAGSDKADPETKDHDNARATDALQNVYTKYTVPADWDFMAGDGEGGTQHVVVPSVDDDLAVDTETSGSAWQFGAHFERELPLVVETADTDADPEYREPFALVYNADAATWHYVERLDAIALSPATLRMLDSELAVKLQSKVNHILAENHWSDAADTDHDPEYDWQKIIVTVAMQTDERLQLVMHVGSQTGDVPRVKVIEMPAAEVWHVAPGTVVDLADGALLKYGDAGYPGEDDNLERDDTERLRQTGALAAAWYGQQRATVAVQIDTIWPGYQAGSLIVGSMGNWHAMAVGTVVSERTFNFRECTTSFRTGYDELDFTGMANFARASKQTGGGNGGGQKTIEGMRGSLSIDTMPKKWQRMGNAQLPVGMDSPTQRSGGGPQTTAADRRANQSTAADRRANQSTAADRRANQSTAADRRANQSTAADRRANQSTAADRRANQSTAADRRANQSTAADRRRKR